MGLKFNMIEQFYAVHILLTILNKIVAVELGVTMVNNIMTAMNKTGHTIRFNPAFINLKQVDNFWSLKSFYSLLLIAVDKNIVILSSI